MSTTTAKKRKRRNMSFSAPLGSLKRIVSSSRTNLPFGRRSSRNEPVFETVTASDLNMSSSSPHQVNTYSTSPTASQFNNNSYLGAPNLTSPLPMPTIRSRSASILNPFRLPPTRSELNNLIIQLQSRISDVGLENQVLRDQIKLVRRDWIEASQELDMARHETWSKETERFKLAIEVEKLVGEMNRLKRGSMLE
jgi:hypothetical protein